jgi:hypothetical protein
MQPQKKWLTTPIVGLGLDPNLYREYESQPAIIAQSIALAPEPGQIG